MKLLNFKWKFVWVNQRFSFFVARVLSQLSCRVISHSVMIARQEMKQSSSKRNQGFVSKLGSSKSLWGS